MLGARRGDGRPRVCRILRYADDIAVFVSGERAAKRVLERLTPVAAQAP